MLWALDNGFMKTNFRILNLAGLALMASYAMAKESVVHVSATAPGTAVAGKPLTILVKFDIQDGYHIYGPNKIETGVPSAISVTSPAGFKVKKTAFPPTVMFKALGETIPVLMGHPVVKLTISTPKTAKGKQTFTVVTTSQACNDRTCKQPQTDNLKVTVVFKK